MSDRNMNPEGRSPASALVDGLRPFQFGVASLLVLTAAVAAILAVLRPLNLPPGFKVGCAGYAIFIAVYIAFRGFRVVQRTMKMRHQLRQRRRELQQWLDQRHSAVRTEVQEPDASGTTSAEGPSL